MNIMHRIRIYHATLAITALLSYVTGEFGLIHAWLGYGVALVIVFRLLWTLSGHRQVGLMRFYPSFEGLNLDNMFTHPAITKTLMLGIALSIIMTTLTGIVIDKGEAIGLAQLELIKNAYADDDNHNDEGFWEEALEETHEFFANLMLIFVAIHATYLLLFKTPLAKFMLFIPKKIDKGK